MKNLLEQMAILDKEVAEWRINMENLAHFKAKFMGKKGLVHALFQTLSSLSVDERKKAGKTLGVLREAILVKYQQGLTLFRQKKEGPKQCEDLSLPPSSTPLGSCHLLTLVEEKVVSILQRIGFEVVEGPEIEDERHIFTALNFPPHHPAREMQDTFFIQKKGEPLQMALRTQTSSIQIRVMERRKPPIRILSLGRVFRKETISARAHCVFHQLEGLYLDKHVTFTDLREVLFHFVHELFGSEVNVRLRPSFFPFTEPSAEVDIACLLCKGKGCRLCKNAGWLEIGGAGMVDPQVLKNCGICEKTYTGFAFGMGIERIAMLLAEIPDVRFFTTNDFRFLKQFASWVI